MKPEEIKLSDWIRIVFGNVPPEFYLELIIRVFLVYLLLMICMRILGKRMAGQISNVSMAAMVALASAIGVPMLATDRGILPAYIIGVVVVGITRIIELYSLKSQRFEEATQGDIDLLVEDSMMNYQNMKRVRITRERLFAELRSENVDHLGRVKRLYLEANGSFSLIENEQPKPGLMVLPDWDKEFIERKVKPTNITICNNCGAEKQKTLPRINGNGKCLHCGENQWTKAVEDIRQEA
jgi:uncharacterized membrane protein YcaP (DUF421 family)